MEILEIGGQLYVPPEEFARVDIPRLLEVIDPQHIAELPVAGIGRDTGVNSEEGRQVSTRDESPRMAQRRAGSARSGGGKEAQASLTALKPLIDRPQTDPAATASIAKAVYHTQNTLRHLEAVGAQTRPV